MIRRMVSAYRRQMLLWKLRAQQEWLTEFQYARRNLHAQEQRAQLAVELTRVKLAKLDGEAMLMGRATVVVR